METYRLEGRLGDAGRAVAGALSEHGFDAYFAGGMVRDLLLSRTPKDVDIATSATPDDVARIFPKVVLVGAQFGVARVILPDAEVEVATFRVEGGYSDGRRPGSVAWATAEEDASRRDFTVNGLFLRPETGEVIDHVGGRADLARRLLRAIGDPGQRFDEDHLRMMRAVRLAVQLGFSIEEGTMRAIREHAGAIRRISAERVRDELVKLLMSPDPAGGIRLLKDTGLLEAVLPEVAAMDGVPQPPEYHPEGDVFTHTMLLLEKTGGDGLAVRLGALLHDIGKPRTIEHRDRIRFNGHETVGAEMADDLMRRLRFGNEEREHVVSLVAHHMRFPATHEMRPSTLKRFLSLPAFEDHLELHRIDCLSSHGNLSCYDFAKGKLEELGRQGIDPEPLLRGRDLIAMGYSPGPRFGEILDRVREAQLDGSLGSSDDARSFVRTHFPAA